MIQRDTTDASPSRSQSAEIPTRDGIAEIVAKLEVHKAALGASRDGLRGLQYEIEEMADIAGDACDNIMYAIDRLSEQL